MVNEHLLGSYKNNFFFFSKQIYIYIFTVTPTRLTHTWPWFMKFLSYGTHHQICECHIGILKIYEIPKLM
jgi:hypothetical protein